MSTQTRCVIDPNKFKQWVEKTKQENGMKTNIEFASELGYNSVLIPNVIARGFLTRPAMIAMKNRFGLALEDVAPDPEPEPTPVEPETATAPAAENQQATVVNVDLTKLEDTQRYVLQAVNAMKEMCDNVQRGFRVQTLPRLDSEMIAEAVRSGMESFWRTKKSEILQMFHGVICAGAMEAGQRVLEMENRKRDAS